MMVLAVEMMMMIPMKSSLMTVTMISPLREGISPTDSCLPESFSLSVVFRPVAAAEYFSVCSLCLGFSGDEISEGAVSEVGQGHHTMPRRGQGVARA